MDDAEACFILSSRNEVDRMAAVRTTAINEVFCCNKIEIQLFIKTCAIIN